MEIRIVNTFQTQIEILPRFSIIYGADEDDEDLDNGIFLDWLWFSMFVYF